MVVLLSGIYVKIAEVLFIVSVIDVVVVFVFSMLIVLVIVKFRYCFVY